MSEYESTTLYSPARAQSCAACVFWYQRVFVITDATTGETRREPQEDGECRRYPPRRADRDGFGRWPKTTQTEWCGEGEQRRFYITEQEGAT